MKLNAQNIISTDSPLNKGVTICVALFTKKTTITLRGSN